MKSDASTHKSYCDQRRYSLPFSTCAALLLYLLTTAAMDPSANATVASLRALSEVYGVLLGTVTSTYVSNILAETVLFGEFVNHLPLFMSLILDLTGVHSMLVMVSLSVLM